MDAVELSLFYFVNDATHEGYVLWGEGVVHESPVSQGVHSQALGEGLHLMRVRGTLDDVAQRLGEAVFPYRRGKVTQNILFGFARRPPILALPPHPMLATQSVGALHQFVRSPKSVALGVSQRPSDIRDRSRLSGLLESLKRHVGVDFRVPEFAPFLGDVFIVADACLRAAPVKVEGIRTANAEALRVTIDPRLAGAELTVNVRLTGSDAAVLDDVLLQWRLGMSNEFVLPANQRFGGAKLRAWREGRLVWQADIAFILEVATTMNLIGRTVLLHDRLTELLQGAITAGHAPASLMETVQRVVQTSHANTSVVGANLREPWRAAAMTAPAEVYALSPPPPLAHEHFPQGGHGRARAIQAFVALIESRQAFLADPFFDAAGAEALLPRMHRDSDLTIVTCLPEASDLESLRRYLRQAAPFLPLKLKVHRVTRRDSKEQAFHDRYVVLMGDEQVPRGFLLSNSFSGAARQYPLVVAEMSPPTTAAVFDDIVALLSHRSIQSIWPPPAEPREQGDSFGKLWRFYLERLVPRAGKTHVQWLDAAKAAGWLELDIDGTPRWSTMRTNEVLDRILGSAPSARWLRRLTSRGGPRLPPIGERVAAVGERAARGLDVTPAEVAGRVPRAKARDLEAFIRTGFRHPEQRDRRRAWLDGIAVHQAMTATEVSLAIVRVGLGFWGDTHAVQDLRQPWGRTFTYRVLLSLDPERAFRVGVELGDPDLIVAALDPWVVEPWGLCVSRAAIHSRSPMVRALGAQSLVAPRERGNFSHAPTSPPPELIGRASVVLQSLDRPTAALCALEWGLHSPHADVRRGLAECFIERYADIATGQRDAVCGAVVNGQRFLEALATVVSIAVANAGEFVEDLLRALEVAVTADHGADGPLDAAADVARILLRASGSSVEGAKRRVRAAFDVDLATSRSGALSPFRRHPDWRVSVVRLSWAQLLFVLIHAHGEVSYGVESLVSFGLVAEVSPTLLARIIADHIPGLAALTEVPW